MEGMARREMSKEMVHVVAGRKEMKRARDSKKMSK